jgi:magnesium chelatase family protein
LGFLAAGGQITAERISRYEFAVELALTGELRPILGALAMTASMIRNIANNHNKCMHQKRAFILPQNSAADAALVKEAIF